MLQGSLRFALGLAALVMANTALGGEIGVEVVFTDGEAAIISAYYSERQRTQTRGKKGRGGLPPGIARNLARGKPLPPGIAKAVLPQELRTQLPPAPDGYERIVIAGKVLLVEIATQMIHDALLEAVLD